MTATAPLHCSAAPSIFAGLVADIDYFVDSCCVPLYSFAVFAYLGFIKWKQHKKRRVAASKKQLQSTTAPPLNKQVVASPPPEEEVIDTDFDLSGVYKMISNENLDAFLATQGVPWALRRAATGVMPNHHIRHQGSSLTIRIHAAGLLETSTSYVIGGPVTETVVRGRLFQDVVRYYKNEDGEVCGIQTEKTAVTEGYMVRVLRILSEDKKNIYMTSSALFPNDPKKQDVISKQVFERIEAD